VSSRLRDKKDVDPIQQKMYRDNKSVCARNQGNDYFKKGEYQIAGTLYTLSLAEAIEGELAALAYSNRSDC